MKARTISLTLFAALTLGCSPPTGEALLELERNKRTAMQEYFEADKHFDTLFESDDATQEELLAALQERDRLYDAYNDALMAWVKAR